MKKFLLVTLALFSITALASDKSSVKLGQVDSSYGQRDCNAPEIAGCGPCFKLCMEQNSAERGAKDVSSSSRSSSKSKSSNASKQ